ncbi:MAG: hypothetical protein ACJ735_11940, partial [Actinomycetes bacterium]
MTALRMLAFLLVSIAAILVILWLASRIMGVMHAASERDPGVLPLPPDSPLNPLAANHPSYMAFGPG